MKFWHYARVPDTVMASDEYALVDGEFWYFPELDIPEEATRVVFAAPVGYGWWKRDRREHLIVIDVPDDTLVFAGFPSRKRVKMTAREAAQLPVEVTTGNWDGYEVIIPEDLVQRV